MTVLKRALSLCVYKASAASSRTILESCLYYTYFRTHPSELATIASDVKYFISKTEIIEFHKMHTPLFHIKQSSLGLSSRLENWYSKISAVVHGQIPGAWNAHTALTDISFSQPTHQLAVASLLEAEKLVHDLLLVTTAKIFWNGFASDAKTALLKGMPGQIKTILELDAK